MIDSIIAINNQRGASKAALDLAKFINLKYQTIEFNGELNGSFNKILYKGISFCDGLVWFGSPNSMVYGSIISGCEQLNKNIIVNPSPLTLRKWIHKNSISNLMVYGEIDQIGKFEVYQDTFYRLWMTFGDRVPKIGEFYEQVDTEQKVIVYSVAEDIHNDYDVVVFKDTSDNKDYVLPCDEFLLLRWDCQEETYYLRYQLLSR